MTMRRVGRKFSSAVSKVVAAPQSAKPSSGGFFDRLSALLVGAGLGFGTSYFMINEELKESNIKLAIAFRKLEDRLAKLEKK